MSTNIPRHKIMPWKWTIGCLWPVGPRVEDPIRVKEFSDALATLAWDASSTRSSLNVVYRELSTLVLAELRYYYKRRKQAGRKAAFFRFLAWGFGTVGVLVPVIRPVIENPPANFLSVGYLAIALAGSFIVADTVFGGTEGHSRYATTQLRIEHMYSCFSIEWQALLVAYDAQPSAIAATALLARAIAYADAFHQSIGSETAEWKVTIKKIQDDLAKQANANATPAGNSGAAS